MPPRVDSVYTNPVLTRLSVGYAPLGFISDQALPRLGNLLKPTGTYWKFGQEQYGPVPETLRLPGTRGREVEWTLEKASYSTNSHALIGKVTDEMREAQDNMVQLEQNTVENTTALIGLDRELRVRDIYTDTSNYAVSNTSSLAAAWAAHDTATPVNDVDQVKDDLSELGITPNTIIIPSDVMAHLKQSGDLIERIKYTQTGLLTKQLISSLFDIPNVLVPASIYNTANAGQAPTLVKLWQNMVWIGYIAPRPGLKIMTFGLTFEYKPRRVRQWREEDKRSNFYEVEEQVGEELISAEAGYLYTNPIA